MRSGRSRGSPSLTRGAGGVTLLEILVALAIVAVALAATYGFVLSTTRSFGLAEGVIESQQTVRFIADRVTEEARWAEQVAPDDRCRPTLLCADRVTLRIPGANPVRPGISYEVTFAHDARTATAVRRQNRTEQTIGDKVIVLEFRYLTADGQPAGQPEAVARIALLVSARPSPREPERTIQTDFLLRNFRPPGGEPTAAPPPPPPPAFRPAPSPPAGLGPIGRATPAPPAPGATQRAPAGSGGQPPPAAPAPAGQAACPPAPDAPTRRPPPKPEVRGALVEISDWEITRAPGGQLIIEADMENLEAHPVLGVRVSATGYGIGGAVVGTASTAIQEIAEGDFELLRITLPVTQPALWILLKIEQYLPRPTAPLHAAIAEVPLELYREAARERITVTATLVPPGPAAVQMACLVIADTAGYPVTSARVTVEVAAVGQRTISHTLDVSAGKTASFPLRWTARVLPGVTLKVEEVRLGGINR